LDIQANVAFGIPKLDGQNKIPAFLLPAGSQQMLGLFDASTGNNPSQQYPATTFLNGDTFVVGVAGTINVFNPVTQVSSPTAVTVGNELLYITGNLINPDGWYYIVATPILATQVGFTPTATISATNAQAAIEEVNSDSISNSIAYAIALG